MVLEVSACQKKPGEKNTTLQAAKECFHLVAFAKETPSLLRLFLRAWMDFLRSISFRFRKQQARRRRGRGEGEEGLSRALDVRPSIPPRTNEEAFSFSCTHMASPEGQSTSQEENASISTAHGKP